MTEQQRLALIVAERIGDVMYACRMTKRGLAIRAGVDERTIRKLLNGDDVKLSTLEKVATALHTEVAALLQRPAA